MELNKTLFWDTDPEKLDEKKHKRFILHRVFTWGDLSNIRTVLKKYSEEDIKKEIVQLRRLDPKTLHFISVIF